MEERVTAQGQPAGAGPLQSTVERVLGRHFGPEETLLRALSDSLRKKGIRVTSARIKRLRQEIPKLLTDGSATLDLSDNEVAHAFLTDDERRNRAVRLELDIKGVLAGMTDGVAAAMPGVVRRLAEEVFRSMLKSGPSVVRSYRRGQRRFEKNVARLWGDCLDLVDMVWAAALEAGEAATRELSTSKADRDVLYVLTHLHARACQVAREITLLLRAGYADGAHARWRTLHEISVTCNFIAERGADAAQRFIMHDHVEAHRAAVQYNEKAERLGRRPIAVAKLDKMRIRVESLQEQYGKAYLTEYGWAAAALNHPKPKFYDIEKAVSLDQLRPYYKMASHNVHSGPRGAFFRLGLARSERLLLAGPSVRGLVEPAENLAISLTQATICLLNLVPTVDRLVACQVLLTFARRVGEEAGRARRRLG